jgi:hypothetical protein
MGLQEMMIMLPTPGQVQERTPIRRGAETMIPAALAPTTKEIPYDYVATFTLEGKRGNRVQQVINISTEGAFVAVAIGYSFIPAKLPPIPVTPPTTPGPTIFLDLLPSSDPTLDWILKNIISPVQDDPRLLAQGLLMKLCGIDFKYSITDSGSGRELQNLAIHNIAGLGESNGERPFRPMAKPMIFMPRSTIRIEVEEISEGLLYTKAELYIVLHGYKMLGYGTG